MGLFFIYSIKVALCLTAFYLLYRLLLSRETFYGFNRAALLSMAAASLALPLVRVQAGGGAAGGGGFVAVEDIIMSAVAAGAPRPAFTAAQVCFAVYIIGVAFFLCREAVSLVSLCRVVRSGRVVSRDGGVRVVTVRDGVSPFSWFGNVIMSESDYASCPREILVHERAHIAGRHSLDILLCDLLIIFQWFNPSAWLLKAELKDLHEFEADRAVLSSGADAAGYQLLLIRRAVGDRLFSMANNLNKSSLKKRIAMMTKKKSNPWSRARMLLAFPVAAVAVVAFATPEAESLSYGIANESGALVSSVMPAAGHGAAAAAEVADTAKTGAAGGTGMSVVGYNGGGQKVKIYDAVEVPPVFPGGMGAMMQYLNENIKYPQAAAEAHIEGHVIVRFIVDADGNVGNPEVVRGVDPALDAEAVRVVSAMPRWTPGRQDGKSVAVKFTLPVSFRLAGDDTDKKATGRDGVRRGPEKPQSRQAGDESAATGTKKSMYILLDGKHVDSLSDIKADDIESIQVYKDKANTVDKYGEAAAGGVIEITLKKK